MVDSECYSLNVEWHDAQADINREYQLTVFVPQRGPLEAAMYDPKAKRSFLKRVAIPDLRVEDLHVGSTVTIYARQCLVKSYGDANTAAKLGGLRTVASFKVSPAGFNQAGQVLSIIEGAGLRITRLRLVNDAGPLMAVEVTGDSAEERLLSVSQSISTDLVQMVSREELDKYFADTAAYPSTAAFDNCTLCIIRPHAVKAGGCGAIISSIMEAGFELSAMQMLQLQRAEAAELHEVYKGVLPYLPELVNIMCAAPCVAIEVRAASGTVEKLRTLCGPHDVDMAKHLRPNSLRAKFGVDNANNGVHCTDLEDDGELEVRYVFEHVLK